MDEISSAARLLADKASPWVVDLSLLALGVGVMIAALTQLAAKFGMFARDIGGAGATPGQVRAITEQALDRKINGGLDRIIAKLDALEDKVDIRHAENQREFGLIHGQLSGRARRV